MFLGLYSAGIYEYVDKYIWFCCIRLQGGNIRQIFIYEGTDECLFLYYLEARLHYIDTAYI